MRNLIFPQLLVVVSAAVHVTHDYQHNIKTQYFAVKTNRSFGAFEKMCFFYGGNLASFLNAKEFHEANSKLSANMRQSWVGLRYNASSNAYVWNSGKTLNQDLLSKIGISYNETIKNITNSGWRCFALKNDGLKSLILQACSSNHTGLCEVRGEISAGDPSSGNPYTAYLSNVQYRTYAKVRCQHHGGHLATFSTMANIQLAQAVIHRLNISDTDEFWIDSLKRYDSKPGQFWWRTTGNPVHKAIVKIINSSITGSYTKIPRHACAIFHADKAGPVITIERCTRVSRFYLCEHRRNKGISVMVK